MPVGERLRRGRDGSVAGGSSSVALAERWNGTRWSIQPTSSPAGAAGAILCGASLRVNDRLHCRRERLQLPPSVERWNGKRWSIRRTPSPAGAMSSALNGVSCTSSKACTAVGSYALGAGCSTFQPPCSGPPLIEHWNGISWSIQRIPNPGVATYTLLNVVSCGSPTACTAVGNYLVDGGAEVTLVER